jgi:hypothetical protein
MKRLLVFAACAFGLFVSANPAYAAGAWSATVHVSSMSGAIPVTCAGPGLTIVSATGNGVQHLNVNGTGDWFTETFEGRGTLVQTAGPVAGIVYQGHVVTWFGSEDNNRNNVQHATFSFNGANVANSADTLAMHAAFDVTANPDGTITANHFSVSCS